MKTCAKFFLCSLVAALPATIMQADPGDANIDAPNLDHAIELLRTHRVSEEEFIRLSQEPGTVILDASTLETYRWMHIKGAVHLTRQEMEAGRLEKILPDKDARIVLYENNNYRAYEKQRNTGDFNELGVPFIGDWSGNIEFTCGTLLVHGYRRLYALASYVRVDRSSLPLVASMSAVDLGKPVALSLDATPAWLGKPFIPDHARF